jgi:hypothetical protein
LKKNLGAIEREEEESGMKTNVRDVGGVQIVELKGKITSVLGDVQLRETINKLVDSGKRTSCGHAGGDDDRLLRNRRARRLLHLRHEQGREAEAPHLLRRSTTC